MKKEDLTVPAIFAEAIGMILGIVYIGLQIYYGIVYKVAPYKFICNIAGVVVLACGLGPFSSSSTENKRSAIISQLFHLFCNKKSVEYMRLGLVHVNQYLQN